MRGSRERSGGNELEQAVKAYLEDQSRLPEVIEQGRPLVYHFARIYSGGKPADDLIQAGFEGLIKAARRYDPGQGVAFATYAGHWIMGEIRHELRREASFEQPEWMTELQRKINRATDSLLAATGEPPTLEQIAEAVNVSVEGVSEALRAGRVSFEELKISQIRHLKYENFKLPIEDVISVRQAIDRLSELQRKVIYAFFYYDLTQSQIARKLGIGQRRVSRILRRGLDLLAKYLA